MARQPFCPRLAAASVLHASSAVAIGHDAKGNERWEGPPLLHDRVAHLEAHAGVRLAIPVAAE